MVTNFNVVAVVESNDKLAIPKQIKVSFRSIHHAPFHYITTQSILLTA